MAESGNHKFFDPFAVLMPELEPIQDAGEEDERAGRSQDVWNFERRSREVERIVIPRETTRRRQLRVGERIGHRFVAESAVFPLSEREKKEAPVETNVIKDKLSLATFMKEPAPLPTYVEDAAAAAPEVVVRDEIEELSRFPFPMASDRERGSGRTPGGRGRPPPPPQRTSSPKNVEKIGVRTCRDVYGLVCSGLCLAANGIIFQQIS